MTMMKTKLRLASFSLAIALVLATISTYAIAGKPPKSGGGGGGGATPATGTIWFSPGWAMDADGGNKQQVGYPGLPSHALHGGARWFLTTLDDELAVVREDGDPASVLYTGIPAGSVFRARWAKDDSFISFSGGPTPFVPGSENAIYRAALDWDGAGLPWLATGFSPVITGTFDEAGDMELGVHFDWSPDGLSVVFIRWTPGFGVLEPVMRVIHLVTGNSTLLATSNTFMEWSPDGTRIALAVRQNESSSQNIYTVSPDGGGWLQVTNAGRSKNDFWPVWSPDSNYIVFGRQQTTVRGGYTTITGDIHRVPAAGGSAVNLTGEMADRGTKHPDAWR